MASFIFFLLLCLKHNVLCQISPLRTAVNEGNHNAVKAILEQQSNDGSINRAEDELSETPILHVQSNSNVVDGSRTPLLHACFEGHTDIVRSLLQHPSVVVSITDELGFNPLHAASWEGHYDVVNLLLKDGRINPQDKTKEAYQHDEANQEGSTPLMMAANNGNEQVLRALIKDGRSDLDATFDGKNLIHLAASNGHAKVVRTLLDIGVDVNTRMKDGCTALYLAAEHGRVGVVKVLLKDKNGKKC